MELSHLKSAAKSNDFGGDFPDGTDIGFMSHSQDHFFEDSHDAMVPFWGDISESAKIDTF